MDPVFQNYTSAPFPNNAFPFFVTTFISAMKVFQSVDVLTSGGPYRSTEVIVFMIYKYAMEDFRMDRASTIAVVFFLVLLAITAATMRISNKRVNYDA